MQKIELLWALLTLTFLNPSGPGNDVIANSSQFTQQGIYATLDICEKAAESEPTILLNTNKDLNLTFTRTAACFATVAPEHAGAWMTLSVTAQHTGLRFQKDGQSVTLPVISYDICKKNLEMMSNLNPDWKTDLPLLFWGSCSETL